MAASIGDSGPYSGEVAPGGPPDTRELAGLIVTKLAVDKEMSNNCYLLRCRATDEQVLIDAAAEPENLRQLIGPSGLTKVITTHQHWDHHRALADIVGATGAVTVAGQPDAAAITEQTGVDIDDQVEQGTRSSSVTSYSRSSTSSATPPARSRCCTTTPTAPPTSGPATASSPEAWATRPANKDAFTSLLDDVSSKIFDRLPDETWFYPGHGNDSVLGNERPHLEEWRERGW